jgi:nitrogen fixation/metabolism regulation signal transduction histidine kinase
MDAAVGLVSLELHRVRLLTSRRLRWLLLIGACLGAISLFLLATATANTEFLAGRYDVLLVVNGAMVVLLMLLVGYQLWRLRVNLKRGVFGSRLAVRLVLLFALVAVLPGALVYAVSVQFLGKSIESWFDVRVDRALEGGLNLGRNSLDYLLKETTSKAGQIALSLSEGGGGSLTTRLNRIVEQVGVHEATLFSATGSCARRRRWRWFHLPHPNLHPRKRCAGHGCSSRMRQSSRCPMRDFGCA